MVMVNGINEDHVGPSRLWVDLSRRWASLGLRSVRFDCNGLGESPWLPNQPSRPVFDKTLWKDIVNAVRAVNLGKAEDSVLIGLCSGAQLALEAALELKSRGVCAINPQVGAGVLRSADDLRHSDRESVRSLARRVETLLKRHQWIGEFINRVSRVTLLSAYSPQVRSALEKNRSNMLLLLGPEDNSPFARIPVVGSAARHRLAASEQIDVEIVPGLDHDFLSTLGRGRAVAVLDRYVIEKYVNGPPPDAGQDPIFG
jgi:alpha-beta hydrolase superfamily lysophospholipase